MANIVDYVRTAADPFFERPISSVDSLVFSWLAYFPLPPEAAGARTREGMRLAELCQPDWLVQMASCLHDPVASLDLIGYAAASPRFRDVRVCDYVTQTSDLDQSQFAAMTFTLPGVGAYVAFRGTDGSLAGWKENFNMAYSPEVPAQRKAREYLEQAADRLGGAAASAANLWVGGHSKGGNLAVFAAMTADAPARARIVRVFDHDGPGFPPEALASPSWQGDASLVEKTVPVDSFVGLILGTRGTDRLTVVRCEDDGIMQHSPLGWVVEGNDFAVEPSVSYAALRQAKRFNAWVLAMDAPTRERLIDTLYDLVRHMGVRSADDVSADWRAFAAQALGSLSWLDADRRAEVEAALEDLAATMLLGPASDFDRSPKNAVQTAQRGAERVEDSSARFYDLVRDLERRSGIKL